MALNKSKTSKGVTGAYWQIYKNDYNKDTNKTLSRMRCYVDKATRDSGINNYLDMIDFKVNRTFDGELNVAECYEAWKTPILVDVLDEDGQPTFEEDGVTKIQEDTNFFTDAEDVLEE